MSCVRQRLGVLPALTGRHHVHVEEAGAPRVSERHARPDGDVPQHGKRLEEEIERGGVEADVTIIPLASDNTLVTDDAEAGDENRSFYVVTSSATCTTSSQ